MTGMATFIGNGILITPAHNIYNRYLKMLLLVKLKYMLLLKISSVS